VDQNFTSTDANIPADQAAERNGDLDRPQVVFQKVILVISPAALHVPAVAQETCGILCGVDAGHDGGKNIRGQSRAGINRVELETGIGWNTEIGPRLVTVAGVDLGVRHADQVHVMSIRTPQSLVSVELQKKERKKRWGNEKRPGPGILLHSTLPVRVSESGVDRGD
jgi:hypothetical protein